MKAYTRRIAVLPSLFALLFFLTVFMAMASFMVTAIAQPFKNGFDLKNSQIAAVNIHQGGPVKDGIPAINKPKFVSASQASFLKADDKVLGVVYGGEARAYPVKILNWHEIVNDTIRGKGIAVTYCPLCGTGMVFLSRYRGKTLHFGVSGLLYNSDVLLYDKETQSLWSQILSKAINGAMVGTPLRSIPVAHIRWKDWEKQHSHSKVLSTDTGYVRDYNRSPYGTYDNDRSIYFPLSAKSNQYHPKERVLGVCFKQACKAYPFSELAQLDQRSIADSFAGQRLTINFDPNNRDGQVVLNVPNRAGQIVSSVNSFWFAWFAFHPQTEVYKAPARRN